MVRQRTIPRCRLALVRDETAVYDPPEDCTRPVAAAQAVRRLLSLSVGEGSGEVLGALYLDGRNRAIGHQVVPGRIGAEGGIKPAAILVPALLANAAAVLLFRCRPGRGLSVEHEEFLFARRIAGAGELLGVKVVDFLIVGDDARYRSLHEGGVV